MGYLEVMKHKLYVTDHLGNRLDEPDTQFILSLAPPVSLTLIELNEVFIDDKIGYEYYATRQAQLNKSIELSTESGQLAIYENIYLPAVNIIRSSPPLKLDQLAMDGFCTEIDIYIEEMKTMITGSFHPCDPSFIAKIAALPDSTPDIRKIRELALLVQDLDAKRPYVQPEHCELKSIPVQAWKPDKVKMQDETVAMGYFNGPCNQRFYIKPVNQVEAKSALARAGKSVLPFYDTINKNGLESAYINKYYNEIVYTETKTTK